MKQAKRLADEFLTDRGITLENRFNPVDKYETVKEAIKVIYHEHKGRYGYRRITKELKKYGFTHDPNCYLLLSYWWIRENSKTTTSLTTWISRRSLIRKRNSSMGITAFIYHVTPVS